MNTEPILRVVHGNPTPEELAALITAVTTRTSVVPTPAEPERAGDWAAYWRNTRQSLHPGPGRWRASAHP